MIDRRLAGWKDSTLSRGGRLILVNSVLTAMPLYMMLCYKIPAWVKNQIDKMRRNFLWKGGREVSSSSCLVHWIEVCWPKSQGGLGVLSLQCMNELLGK